MKRLILLLIALLPSTFYLLPIQATTLDEVMALLEQKTLQSKVTLSVAATGSQPLQYSGTITMCGDKFHVQILGIEAAYDGQTMYMYSEDLNELTLSKPTKEELMQTNPFLFARELKDACNITERAITLNGATGTLITLTPKNIEALPQSMVSSSGKIQKFVLQVTKDKMPSSIEMKEPNQTTTLTFQQPTFVTGAVFTISKPNAYLNDLR